MFISTLNKKKLKMCIALRGVSELRSVTCHMGSHSVTCHPTQVSAPCLNPSHAGRYSIYLPWRDGRLSLPCYSETQQENKNNEAGAEVALLNAPEMPAIITNVTWSVGLSV